MYARLSSKCHGRRLDLPCAIGGLLLLWPVFCLAQANADDPAQPDSFQDRPETLLPDPPRTELQERKLASAAYYAHGRLQSDRRELKGALQNYQRAWRYNPDATAILPEIVKVAFALGRVDQAARYAARITEPQAADSLLFKRLALELSAKREWEAAISLYEKSEASGGQASLELPGNDVGSVLLCLEMGRLYFLTGDYGKSAQLFSRVREVLENPEELSKNQTLQKMVLGQPERTYQMLGESFLQAGLLEAAESMFRKHHEAKPDAAALAFQLARIAAQGGQPQTALDLLGEYFSNKSQSAGIEPYEMLVEQRTKLAGDDEPVDKQILARLEELLEADPQNNTLMFFLATHYLEAEQWDRAQQLFENLATINPSVEAYDGLIRIHYHRREIKELALTLGNACARAGSFDPFAQAMEDLLADQDLRQALLASIQRRLETQPDQVGSGEILAAAWLALEGTQFDEGNRLFGLALKGLEANRQSDALLNWGVQLLLAQQYAAAADTFRQAIELPVENLALFYFYRVRALALAKRPDEALKLAEQAVMQFPDLPRLAGQPGWVLYYAKRHAEAEKRLRQLVEKYDDNHESDLVREQLRDTRLMLSNLCILQGRNQDAEQWLEEVLDEFPDDIGAMNDLGYLWTDQGKYLEWSLEMIQRAVAAEPDNTAYIDSLGWSYYQLGRYEEAVEQLEKAAADEDPDGVILDHLGDAYAKAGRKRQALETYRRAREAFEKAGETDKRQEVDNKIQQFEK